VSDAGEGVDVHAHGVPGQFLEEVRRTGLGGVTVEAGDGRYVVTFPGGQPLRPVAGIMLEFAGRLGWLDEQGMRRQLIAPWLDVHGQELPPGPGADWVRLLNDAMADAVATGGGRLLAHATLHLADPQVAARELDRTVRELGMTACMIPTNLPQGTLDESRYDAVWEAAQALGAPVVLHPPTVAPSGCLFGDLPRFRGLYGRLIDSTVAAARLIVAGVFDRFPDLRLVLVHGGGFLPYQTGRFDREYDAGDAGGGLEHGLPSDYVRRFYYDTVLLSAPSLRLLFELIGADRVVIGSDYAATPVERAGGRLTDALDQTGVDARTRELVLHRTAESLFRIAVSPR
jgi:aminocarboxymuconate-semialdehyde decarboxylase